MYAFHRFSYLFSLRPTERQSFNYSMSPLRRQQSRSSSSQRSRSSRSDQRATLTAAQFEALNISSNTPPPSIAVHRTPEYVPSDLTGFDTNLAVAVSQAQQDWSSLQMTATVDPNSVPLPFSTGGPNCEIIYSGFPLRQEHMKWVEIAKLLCGKKQ